MNKRQKIIFFSVILLLVIASLGSMLIGQIAIGPGDFISILAKRLNLSDQWSHEVQQEGVLIAIRIPRILAGLMVGAALGISGAAMQGLFRNPLADPSLIGISSGAAFSATLIIVLGGTFMPAIVSLAGVSMLSLGTFIGAFLISILVFVLAGRGGKTNVSTLLLVGIAINTIAAAGTGLLISMASDTQIRTITFWSMGSLAGVTWAGVAALSFFALLPALALVFTGNQLNIMALGEREASTLGIKVENLKRIIIGLAAMSVGASVAMSGVIGFVGLIVPHLLRLIGGPSHKFILPASAAGGAALLCIADTLARVLKAPEGIPIGIITALLGGPLFLALIFRSKKQLMLA